MRSQKKHNFSNLPKIVLAVFVIIFVAAIFLITRSGFFIIKQIEVTSNKVSCADEHQLKTYSGLLGQNFFLVNSGQVAKDIKLKFICVKNVTLTRSFLDKSSFFDKVRIEVTPREPVAVLVLLKEKEVTRFAVEENLATPSAQDVEDSSLVDDEGVIFSKDTGGIYVPKIYSYAPDILLNNALKILDKVLVFGIEVKDTLINTGFFIINPSGDRPKIIFRLNDEIDIQLASLQLIQEQAKIESKELEFIDLRFDKPIVKFAPKKNGER